MARENILEYCAPRIALGLSHCRVDPRPDLVPVSWDGCDARPASPGRDDAARAGVGGRAAVITVDRGGFRGDGYQRSTSLLCHPGADLPEYFLSDQDRDVDTVRH